MLHTLVITSSYFHSSQFLRSVVYSFKWQMGKKNLFSCPCGLGLVLGVAGGWCLVSLWKQNSSSLCFQIFFWLGGISAHVLSYQRWETEDINCNILKLSQYCTHLYVSTNIFLKISPSLQNRLNSFQDHIPC